MREAEKKLFRSLIKQRRAISIKEIERLEAENKRFYEVTDAYEISGVYDSEIDRRIEIIRRLRVGEMGESWRGQEIDRLMAEIKMDDLQIHNMDVQMNDFREELATKDARIAELKNSAIKLKEIFDKHVVLLNETMNRYNRAKEALIKNWMDKWQVSRERSVVQLAQEYPELFDNKEDA